MTAFKGFRAHHNTTAQLVSGIWVGKSQTRLMPGPLWNGQDAQIPTDQIQRVEFIVDDVAIDTFNRASARKANGIALPGTGMNIDPALDVEDRVKSLIDEQSEVVQVCMYRYLFHLGYRMSTAHARYHELLRQIKKGEKMP